MRAATANARRASSASAAWGRGWTVDGSSAQGYATAFDVIVGTAERIAMSEHRLTVLLLVIVIGLTVWVWHLWRHKLRDLAQRLSQCETRHDACGARERRNILAIATLHGVICSMQSALPPDHPMRRAGDNVRVPTLAELLSGDEAIAHAANPAAEAVLRDT